MKKPPIPFVAPLAALALIAGCTSPDRKAATAAASAQAALDAGQVVPARRYIQQALAIRDDISDYWLILAHVALTQKDTGGAFDAYVNVLQLDRANVEALTGVCQIALAANAPERAEKYADQLAAINPSDPLPNTVKAAAAATRHDKAGANRYLDLVFAGHPGDTGALLVKARMLAADDDYAGAAKVIEQTMAAPGNPSSRLAMLTDFYTRARDRAGMMRSVARLAQTNADDPALQLQYADLLFDQGDGDAARAAIARAAQPRPDDIGIAATALNIWLKQGADAIPADRLLAEAANASLAWKAAYAQYASETGRPQLAIRILDDAGLTGAAMSRPDTAEAAAALAYARGLTGDRPGADALIAAVLKFDPDQPRALLARGRLRALAGDAHGAIEDVRQAVAQDGDNVAARLTLVDLLLRNNEQVLGETALRDAMRAVPDDPRLALRLARYQTAAGRRADASATLADFARNNPVSLRAAGLKTRA